MGEMRWDMHALMCADVFSKRVQWCIRNAVQKKNGNQRSQDIQEIQDISTGLKNRGEYLPGPFVRQGGVSADNPFSQRAFIVVAVHAAYCWRGRNVLETNC